MKKFIDIKIKKTVVHWIIAGLVVVILTIIGVIFYLNNNKTPTFGTVAVTTGNIISSLNETGNVTAENHADLSFLIGGEIASINVKEGDHVNSGDVIARLDTSSLQTNVSQAQAGLQVAQANLQNLENGTRPEQLKIYNDSVSQANSVLDSANASLKVAQNNAYVAVEDSIDNQTDNLFNNPKFNNPVFLVPITNSQTIIDIESKRVEMQSILNDWYNLQNSTTSDISSQNIFIDSNLTEVQSYLDELAIAVNNPIQASLSQTNLSSYKSYVITARNEVMQVTSALTSAQNAVTQAQANLKLAQSQLALAQAGATQEQIDAQNSLVAQAQATLDSAKVTLDHATLLAPFSGIIRNKNMNIGQVVNVGTPVISIINDMGLKIETYVSQSDIAKIQIGDNANITLDAYGNSVEFPATVTNIDSAGTQTNGIISYKVTLHFKNSDSRVKTGMTANINIIVAEKDNVLEIPNNLIISNGNNNFVLVQNGGTFEKKQISVGLIGDNGMTEILSGLSATDRVTNF